MKLITILISVTLIGCADTRFEEGDCISLSEFGHKNYIIHKIKKVGKGNYQVYPGMNSIDDEADIYEVDNRYYKVPCPK